MTGTATLTAVRNLRQGDVTTSGYTIVNVYADTKTRKGYKTVVVKGQNGSLSKREWNASTNLTVTRAA